MHDLPRDSMERPERVKLDETLVELCTDSPDEAFEADGLNVGPGGLAVRSPLLPEVGARMRCRFASPIDGATIDAECEVVWASDQGPNLGEFGLRFERLSGESAESLRRLVEPEDRMLTADEAADLGWSVPPQLGPSTIALALDGVGSELVAEVAHDASDVLVAEQELPFLRIGTGVTTEDGRRGVLQSVELRMEGELPRLVLTVDYDDVSAEASDEDDAPSLASAPSLGDTATSRDAAWQEADDALDEALADRPTTPFVVSSALDDDALDDDEASFASDSDHDTIPDGRPAFALDASRTTEKPAREKAVEKPRTRVREVGEPVLAKANAVASAVKDVTHDRLSSAIPAVKEGLENARESATLVAARGLERSVEATRTLATRLRHFVDAYRARSAASAEAPATKARRVQRRPGERVTEPAAEAKPTPSLRGRHVVLAVFGLIVLVSAIRGVMRAPDAAPAVTPPPVETPAAIAPVPEPTNVVAPTPAVTPPPVAGTVTTPTVGAPAYGAGPIPTPTYPSLDRGTTAEVEAAPAPTTPPSRHFGAASVPGATPFELLMTTPIERIEGQETETGFVVQITRSNSLTRASPIAAQHPDVDRASVTNAGENATLRIDWKPGRHPAYRVEANGNRLRILLGR